METTDYCFSFFRKPIQNIEPMRAIGIVDVYRYVIEGTRIHFRL